MDVRRGPNEAANLFLQPFSRWVCVCVSGHCSLTLQQLSEELNFLMCFFLRHNAFFQMGYDHRMENLCRIKLKWLILCRLCTSADQRVCSLFRCDG